VKANGTEKGVGEVRQQVEGKYGESKDRARQIGDEAVDNAQAYADTDSPEEAEEKKRGMREKIRQMGVSPICPL
jgi:vacuolar-type H+-ATPase subunit H